ncbi:LADA_0E12728g1_1 [Lachancea dasiensis]|uniref:LADA_0E12728g1_1 n=1 Tax=Lachancea dasiensis TaxID=1072105 RepID=A0A1G4JFK9_9SACH|nr:LADA_0E12728g1_1 [Lachancea dasiensis]
MLRSRTGLKPVLGRSPARLYYSENAQSSKNDRQRAKNIKDDLQHVLSLSNRITRESNADCNVTEEADERPALELRKKLDQFPQRIGEHPSYVRELDQMLQLDRPGQAYDKNKGDARHSTLRKTVSGPEVLRENFHINADNVEFEPVALQESESKPPRLCHELDRVLFQPMNFHTLQDSRSGTYNFSKWLEDIIRVDDFDFDAVSEFVTSSRDKDMLQLAEKYQKRYYSSTSSMTGVLSHMHFLLSNFRKSNMSIISKHFRERSASFSRGAQLPAVVIMKRMKSKKGIFSIDSDKSSDREIILSLLGHALETVLTTEEQQFKRTFDKSKEDYKGSSIRPEGKYHYSKIENFVLRSQLDAYHPKLPGTGIFDLKTRAVAAVRHDIAYVEENDNYTGYQLQQVLGKFESFERELFELIRSTMLKYSLQARIGRMDGIFVAYHNISKMFGFQYIPLEEMDHILHSYGCPNFESILQERNDSLKAMIGDEAFILKHDHANLDRDIASNIADSEFKISMSLLSQLLRKAEKSLPAKFSSCRIVFKTESKKISDRSGNIYRKPVLNVLIAPLTEEQTSQFQRADLTKEFLQDGKNIDTYVEKTRRLNMATAKDVIGFEIHVNHKVHHHPGSIVNPRIANKKSTVLDDSAKQFVKTMANKNFYSTLKEWKHVQFFHPLDVLKWTPEFSIRQLGHQDRVKKLYMHYLDDKLYALKGQTVVRKPSKSMQEIIAERIRQFMSGDAKCKKREGGAIDENEVSQLQAVLRAYSKKGELAKRRHK